ncbi:uridine kinase family protein [Actinokineospora sp. 24-640]
MIDRVADAVLAGPPRLGGVRLVAVDGPSGSGKSTYAAALADALGAAVIPTDHFATWDDPVAWWPRLREGVLVPLAAGRQGGYQRTEWSDGRPRPGAWLAVDPPGVLLLEGVSAGRRSLRSVMSALVWIELPDPAARLERAVARDGESCRAPLTAWQRFEAGWFAVDQTRSRATHRPPIE